MIGAVVCSLVGGLAASVGAVALAVVPSLAEAPAQVVFEFQDPAIAESSGLVDLGPLMVTTNDSGDDAVVYTVDPLTGETVGRTRYAAAVRDVEALAPSGTGHVWVGDIGDNNAVRDEITLYRVPVARGDRTVTAAPLRLRYPDGAHDAEALAVLGDRLTILTKGPFGAGIYQTPARLGGGTATLVKVGRLNALVTDAAAYGEDRLLVRGYGTATLVEARSWRTIGRFALPAQEQGEAISVGPDQRVRISSEGERSEVLQVKVPGEVLGSSGGSTVAAPSAQPSTDTGPAPQVEQSGSAESSSGSGLPWGRGLGLGLGLLGGGLLLAAALRWSRR